MGAQGDGVKAVGFLTSHSWRKSAVMLAVALMLTGLGFAVRYAEDNQIGETNQVSWWVFVVAGVCAYWSALGFVTLMLRTFYRRALNGQGRASDDAPGEKME